MATAYALPHGFVAVATVAGFTVRSLALTLMTSPVAAAIDTLKLPSAATVTAGAATLLVSSCTTSEIGAAASAIAPGVPVIVAPVEVRTMLMREVVTSGGATTPAMT